jgi:UDP-glucose 4-epimerase
MEKKILITGGNGVLGSGVLSQCLEDYKCICIGRDLSRFSSSIRFHKNFKFYQIDLKRDHLDQIDDEIFAIIHLAGMTSSPSNSEPEYFENNTEAIKPLIQFALKKRIQYFLFTSSFSVYMKDYHPYAESKRRAEKLLMDSGIPYSIWRLGSIYGADSKSFIEKNKKFYKNRIWFLPINQEYQKSFLSKEDFVNLVNLWLKKPIRGLWDVVEKKPVSYSEIDINLRRDRTFGFRIPWNLINLLYGIGVTLFPEWKIFKYPPHYGIIHPIAKEPSADMIKNGFIPQKSILDQIN